MQYSAMAAAVLAALVGLGTMLLLRRSRNSAITTSMEILVLTYEFTYSPFSGNGVLARSLVKGLLSCGHRVVVCCCKPHPEVPGISADNPIDSDRLKVEAVELSASDGWRRLDDTSAWQRYTDGVAKAAVQGRLSFSQGPATFGPSSAPAAVLAIDWTGCAAWRRIQSAFPKTRMLYVNFRVYSSGLSSGEAASRAAWHDEREAEALAAADRILALSVHDQASLQSLQSSRHAAREARTPAIGLLLPCLRGDMQALAQQPAEMLAKRLPPAVSARLDAMTAPSTLAPTTSASWSWARDGSQPRRLLVCGVRLSAEKNPMLFARVIDRIATKLEARGVVPLLFGASAEPQYAGEVKQLVQRAGGLVLEQFLGPEDMAALYAVTRLNFHPCLYDAYGMSIVEAAAFGAPTVVNSGGTIGASALLGLDAGCIGIGLTAGDAGKGDEVATLASRLLEVLDDAESLKRVARIGRERALGWGEEACGRKLHDEMVDMSEEAVSAKV